MDAEAEAAEQAQIDALVKEVGELKQQVSNLQEENARLK